MNITKLLLDTYFGDNDSILVLGDYCEENNIYFQGLINANVEESLYSNLYDYSGNGNGDGYGDGHGNGHGNGNGDGYNYGYGDGNGYGQPINYSDCNDNGNGNNIKEFYL